MMMKRDNIIQRSDKMKRRGGEKRRDERVAIWRGGGEEGECLHCFVT
jgi:hypothetical protein